MSTVADIATFLEQIAPVRLAEDWDNVGLLVGRRDRHVRKLMTCLTVTPTTAAEAVQSGVDLIVTHHPMPFRPVQRLTDDATVGRLLLDLIAAGVAVYSPHTAFDSALQGVNARLAEGLQLQNVVPLIANEQGQSTGRCGRLGEPITLEQLGGRLKQFLSIERLQMVGEPDRIVQKVAVACGAADELLDAARVNVCDVLVIGEARFHTCLEAESLGIALLLPGHYASERFAVDALAEMLAGEFPEVQIWPSRLENDPIRCV